jgi:hypothetical protein
VDWADEALVMSADMAGISVFLQAIGKRLWDKAISSRSVPMTFGGIALTLTGRLTTGSTARAENAHPSTRGLLPCCRLDGVVSATLFALVSRMHKSRARDLSVASNELIKKGLDYPPARHAVLGAGCRLAAFLFGG